MSKQRRIVIVGGGFGGVFAAKHLESIFGRSKDVEIVLISEQNYLLFTPMLPEVPSSSIEAKQHRQSDSHLPSKSGFHER